MTKFRFINTLRNDSQRRLTQLGNVRISISRFGKNTIHTSQSFGERYAGMSHSTRLSPR